MEQVPTTTTYNRFGGWFNRYKRPMPTSASERRELVHEIQACNGHSRGDSASTTGNYPPQEQQSKTGIWWDVAPSEEYFKEAFRVSKNQIIWGANYFPNMPPTRCFLVWRKLSISENFSMAMAEYAWTSFNSNAKVFEGAPQGTKKEPRFHPTQKSVALYKWILANYAKPTDRILDTHLGSGSSAIACHDFGCEMLGIEIDDIYYEKAKQRLIDHQQQLTLF